jgi:methanogenic corrinoid protein MtbC1
MSEMQYSMKAAATATGLSPHVIRIWEKRYGAVNPDRSDTNRRRYAEADLNRLRLLKSATLIGHNIGQIARLEEVQLKQLLAGAKPVSDEPTRDEPLSPKRFVQRAFEAIHELDSAALDQSLSDAAVSLGTQGLLQKVVVPLAQKIGERWQAGDISAGQEHFATALIRGFLSSHSRPYVSLSTAPTLVVATPSGQLHELGTVIVAAAAASAGWRVVNLGVSLPATEIAAAAFRSEARAVALSVVFPMDDPLLADDLRNLRRLLSGGQRLLVGGRAVAAYAAVLKEIGATICHSLDDLNEALLSIGP